MIPKLSDLTFLIRLTAFKQSYLASRGRFSENFGSFPEFTNVLVDIEVIEYAR